MELLAKLNVISAVNLCMHLLFCAHIRSSKLFQNAILNKLKFVEFSRSTVSWLKLFSVFDFDLWKYTYYFLCMLVWIDRLELHNLSKCDIKIISNESIVADCLLFGYLMYV